MVVRAGKLQRKIQREMVNLRTLDGDSTGSAGMEAIHKRLSGQFWLDLTQTQGASTPSGPSLLSTRSPAARSRCF